MRIAVSAFNATHDRALARDHGPAARLPLTGELTMQIVDQRADALDAHDLTRAEVVARSQAWDYLDAFREHLDGWENAYLVATGPQIGVGTRRSRARRSTTFHSTRCGRSIVRTCGRPGALSAATRTHTARCG